MKKETVIMSMIMGMVLLTSIVTSKTVGIIDVRTNFSSEIVFPEFVDLHNQFIENEIKVADVWVKNSTVPLYITLFNGTNIDEEHVVFWVETPIKKLILPLEVNKTTNITTSESGNYTIWQIGKQVGTVHAQLKIECDHCNITQV